MSTGIAGSPDQLADGVNADYVAEVFSDRAVKVRFGGVSTDATTGAITGIRTDTAGRVMLSERAMLQAMLQESRLQTFLIHCLCTNQPVPDDLDALRLEPTLVYETDSIELEN